MPSKRHTVSASKVTTTHRVLPGDTNTHGTIFGGQLMQWLDIAASIAATRHCRRPVVTASIDDLHFLHPIHEGDIVIIEAEVAYTGKTSMEIRAQIYGEESLSGDKKLTSQAFLTFVAIDRSGEPVEIPTVIPETDEEKQVFENAKIKRLERIKRLSFKS